MHELSKMPEWKKEATNAVRLEVFLQAAHEEMEALLEFERLRKALGQTSDAIAQRGPRAIALLKGVMRRRDAAQAKRIEAQKALDAHTHPRAEDRLT